MKYPVNQFESLVSILKQLKKYVDVETINPSNLHYIAYVNSQVREGLSHNVIYTNGTELRKAHSIENFEGWNPIVNKIETFELYPNECNDNNIETAVKKALKLI